MDKERRITRAACLVLAILLFISGMYFVNDKIDSFSVSSNSSPESILTSPTGVYDNECVISRVKYDFNSEYRSASKAKHIQHRVTISQRSVLALSEIADVYVLFLLSIREVHAELPGGSNHSIIEFIHSKDGSKPVLV